MHKVGIIGLGFVGTAVETGLQALVKNIEIRAHDKYKPSESLEEVVENSDILFICLPTPMNEDGSCNISIIEKEIKNIRKLTKKPKIIVIKSTVPPGTTLKLQEDDKKNFYVFNPEFLTEKNFINDFLEQDRIILGHDLGDETDLSKLFALYREFIKNQKNPGKIIVSYSDEAEMLKYMTNCFLATKVIFFNEMKEICQAGSVNYESVLGLLALDKRVGNTHVKVPGPDGKHGFGGSCFPKDLNALIAYARDRNVDPMLLDAVWSKNLLVREEYEWENLAQVNGQYKKDEQD